MMMDEVVRTRCFCEFFDEQPDFWAGVQPYTLRITMPTYQQAARLFSEMADLSKPIFVRKIRYWNEASATSKTGGYILVHYSGAIPTIELSPTQRRFPVNEIAYNNESGPEFNQRGLQYFIEGETPNEVEY